MEREPGLAPPGEAAQARLVVLDRPRDGVPDVISTPDGLAVAADLMASGSGPVAVDAERASGHRYGQRAFLVQLRREGAGTALVDPAALPDLSELGEAISDAEWVVHAASQDLPCLAEVGLRPTRLFDTELGARLAGYDRVGLASMVEALLGLSLAKEHSAVDWSMRPLPEPWLRYAALDVEVLIDLRDVVEADLAAQDKLGWAHEEFAALVAAPPPAPRPDQWRRTSGMHRIRTRRQLAVVRELWTARESLARQRDIAPGRLLPDSAIIEAALAQPADPAALVELPGFTGRAARGSAGRWSQAVSRGRDLAEADLPPQHLPAEGPPPPRIWAERDPAAAARLGACRRAVLALAVRHRLPAENLISPDAVRRLAWEPPDPPDVADVADALRALGVREWQIELTAADLAAALALGATA